MNCNCIKNLRYKERAQNRSNYTGLVFMPQPNTTFQIKFCYKLYCEIWTRYSTKIVNYLLFNPWQDTIYDGEFTSEFFNQTYLQNHHHKWYKYIGQISVFSSHQLGLYKWPGSSFICSSPKSTVVIQPFWEQIRLKYILHFVLLKAPSLLWYQSI